MRVLWLITARSGSKGIPNKNVKLLGGKPLLAHRILNTPPLHNGSDLWLSTDSSEYSKIAQSYGCKAPFLRPENLSDDSSSSIDVVLHAMDFAESQGMCFDYIGLLEPTSPFVTSVDLELALKDIENNINADSIVAVRENRPNTCFVQDEDRYLSSIANNIKELSKLGRQNFKRQITPSGGFYIARWNKFKEVRSFYTPNTLAYLVDDQSGLEIDEPLDWLIAEAIISNRKNNLY